MADKKKILMIDDESDLCYLVKTNLEETGRFIVETTTDPDLAVSLGRQISPDVILLDIVMPKVNGLEVANSLKKDPDTVQIPIIAISGLGEMVYLRKKDKWSWLPNRPVALNRGELAQERDPQRAAAIYGVDGYIAKPFKTEVLIKVIEEALKKDTKHGDSA